MNAADFLCAWCVDNPAVAMDLDDGKQRPVCESCSSSDVGDPFRAETMTDRVLAFVTERPGATTGDMRRAFKVDRKGLEELCQQLRRLSRLGRLERTGVPSSYRYWPVAKKEAA
jgi:hypothetical protein